MDDYETNRFEDEGERVAYERRRRRVWLYTAAVSCVVLIAVVIQILRTS